MHILYLVFRVLLELFVIIALFDYAMMQVVTWNRWRKAGKDKAAYSLVTIAIVLMLALVLRLYIFNPVI